MALFCYLLTSRHLLVEFLGLILSDDNVSSMHGILHKFSLLWKAFEAMLLDRFDISEVSALHSVHGNRLFS